MKLKNIKFKINEQHDDTFDEFSPESLAESWINGNKNTVYKNIVKMKTKDAIAVTGRVMRILGPQDNKSFLKFLELKQ